MKAFVKEYVAGCAICQQNKIITWWNQLPLQPIGPEERPMPFAMMSVDFMVKLPLLKGNDTILTVTNQGCTKVVILVPCWEDMGTEAIADLFKEHIFPIQASHKAYLGLEHPLHVFMVQRTVSHPWNRSKYEYRIPPTNRQSIRGDKPDHGRALANILQPPSEQLGRMACAGTVHYKQPPFKHDEKSTVWSLDGTHPASTSNRKRPQGFRPDNTTKDPWINKGGSCAGHVACRIHTE